MRTRSILLVAGILTMSLATLPAGLTSASAQIYDWATIAGMVTNSGTADGTNSNARFDYPMAITLDANGNAYVADFYSNTIRKVALVGTNWVTGTIAGSAGNSGSTDGTNSAAKFYLPRGVAVDTNGNVYVADTFNHTIRKITPVGENWVTTTIAGLAGNMNSTDGTNSAARFHLPSGIAVDTNANLYVADYGNHTIRKITPVGTNWVTTTIAGLAGVTNWVTPTSADGTNSDARFYAPYGIAVDSIGNVYVADFWDYDIRKITPVETNWVTTTIAGLAFTYGSADGTNSAARFGNPTGVAVDTNGNLYVADNGNSTIRKVMPVGTNWVTTTIAGLALNPGSADGIDGAARFRSPYGVAVDTDGNLYVADTDNDTIRLGVAYSGILTIIKETAKLNFAKPNSDGCTLTATLDLDAGYNLTNKLVSLDIGGASASFTLDAKGKGRGVGANGTCKLSYKKKTGPWTFTAKLKNGSWATQWQAYGLANATTNSTVTLPVTLVIGDDAFFGEKTLLYKAKAGKSGTAK